MKKIISILLSFGVLMTSCSKFFDINDDPNNPSFAAYPYVLPAAIASSAAAVGGQYAMLGSLWSQHFTQSPTASQYDDLDSYRCLNNKFPATWTEVYAGGLNDYAEVIRQTVAAEDWATYLMAVTMRCYTLAVMVDLYDTVPYTEALKGKEGVAFPRFDAGPDIYNGLLAELDEALSKDFTAYTNTDVGSSDYIFGGNVDKWIQFANTLKLKMYLRMVNANPSAAEAGVRALYSAGANFLTEPAAMSAWANEAGKYNPFYGTNVAPTGVGDVNLRASETLFNYLTGNSDSRVEAIYRRAPNYPDLLANRQGATQSTDEERANRLSRGQWDPVQPVYFFTLPEIYFLQAEAQVRYPSLGGNPQALYESGVRASFDRLGAAGADALLAGAYSYTAAEDKLRAIIVQKWVSQAMYNPIESFFDFNRTGYPDFFVVSATSVLGDMFPQRLVVSDTDEGLFNPNCPMNLTIATKVWWAK
jgi:hypothetical protein